jgi:hypothetical protein
VNLFNGFGMEPKAGEYNLILELLFHLCGEDQDVFHWVVCWLAYPLQNPGAKMATSIIMHGDEGSGKNLFLKSASPKFTASTPASSAMPRSNLSSMNGLQRSCLLSAMKW